LFFDASGSVFLTRITADDNTNLAVAGTPSGIFGSAVGSITITCGSMILNEGYGYSLTAGTTITLKGVFTYGNGLANFTNVTPTVTRACPLP
jgi:hypothetical protein